MWLACSKQLEACAIKIKQCKDPLKEKEEAEEEANKWTLLGYNRSRAVRLNGKYAIVMPYFCPCTEDNILQGFSKMATSAIQDLSNLFYCHKDIHLRNFGTELELEIVTFTYHSWI